MKCSQCHHELDHDAFFCEHCGHKVDGPPVSQPGYSLKISDPAFNRYLKNSNAWSAYFAIGLALIAVIGFFIAGEMGVDNLENPQALMIGGGVGSLFLLIAFFQIIGRKRSKTWDGQVTNKYNTLKKERIKDDTGTYTREYMVYTVVITDRQGKDHHITSRNDDTLYQYWSIGDHVRHHAGLNTYEKFDKTKDTIIFCAACATLCDINDDVCFRCKCPLLK